jgi:hypothetical protein
MVRIKGSDVLVVVLLQSSVAVMMAVGVELLPNRSVAV